MVKTACHTKRIAANARKLTSFTFMDRNSGKVRPPPWWRTFRAVVTPKATTMSPRLKTLSRARNRLRFVVFTADRSQNRRWAYNNGGNVPETTICDRQIQGSETFFG